MGEAREPEGTFEQEVEVGGHGRRAKSVPGESGKNMVSRQEAVAVALAKGCRRIEGGFARHDARVAEAHGVEKQRLARRRCSVLHGGSRIRLRLGVGDPVHQGDQGSGIERNVVDRAGGRPLLNQCSDRLPSGLLVEPDVLLVGMDLREARRPGSGGDLANRNPQEFREGTAEPVVGLEVAASQFVDVGVRLSVVGVGEEWRIARAGDFAEVEGGSERVPDRPGVRAKVVGEGFEPDQKSSDEALARVAFTIDGEPGTNEEHDVTCQNQLGKTMERLRRERRERAGGGLGR